MALCAESITYQTRKFAGNKNVHSYLHALSTQPSTMVTKEKSMVGVTLIRPSRLNSCSRGDGISACTILAMLPGASLHSHTRRIYSPSCASESALNRSASRSMAIGLGTACIVIVLPLLLQAIRV